MTSTSYRITMTDHLERRSPDRARFSSAAPGNYRIDPRYGVPAETPVVGMNVVHVGSRQPFEDEADAYGRMRLARPACRGEGRSRFH